MGKRKWTGFTGRLRNRDGMEILEMLVVVTILSILVITGYSTLSKQINNSEAESSSVLKVQENIVEYSDHLVKIQQIAFLENGEYLQARQLEKAAENQNIETEDRLFIRTDKNDQNQFQTIVNGKYGVGVVVTLGDNAKIVKKECLKWRSTCPFD
jgi:competence protein ComGC